MHFETVPKNAKAFESMHMDVASNGKYHIYFQFFQEGAMARNSNCPFVANMTLEDTVWEVAVLTPRHENNAAIDMYMMRLSEP